MDCLFCKIASKELDTPLIYEDDKIVVFDDINPQAPVHKLIVSKEHIATTNELDEKNNQIIGKMFLVAKDLAKSLEIAEDGYRLIMNCNPGAGQTVFHIHLHLVGGRQMNWPPG